MKLETPGFAGNILCYKEAKTVLNTDVQVLRNQCAEAAEALPAQKDSKKTIKNLQYRGSFFTICL